MARHRLELAKTGSWGKDGSTITKQDIAEVVETFVGKKPAIIGHVEGQSAPKFGDVLALSASGDGLTLLGDVMLLEVAESLYGDGYYNGWSVAIPRRATDGKRYFHHLAFLGATPPKIPGLAELPFESVSYGDKESAESFSFGGKLQEVGMDDLEKVKAETEKLAKEKAALEKELEKELEKLKNTAGGKKEEKAKPVFSDEEKTEAKSGEYADLQKQIAELKTAESATRLNSFSDLVASKLPKGVREKANRLAQSVEGVRSFEFADGKKEDALSLLKDVLVLWPSPVMGSVASEFADSARNGEKQVDWGKIASGM